jgi:6-phosphogluconolactonase
VSRREVFPDAKAACERVAALVEGARLIGVSGGNTAAALFYVLAEAGIHWSQKHLFWVDERCVPPDHKDSNYGLCRRLLLNKVRVPEDQIHRMRGEDDPAKAAADYEAELRRFAPRGWDLTILGVGPDGHTASLFPGTPALAETARWCVPNVASNGSNRLTTTFPFLEKSKALVCLALGEEKREVVREHEGKPIARLEGLPGFTWLLDVASSR